MPAPAPDSPGGPEELARVRRRLERERAARLEMETVYEGGLRELYLREQELRLLQDIATAANLSQSVRDVFQYALNRICEYMAWPVGHVYLTEERDGVPCLHSTALWHLREPDKTASFRDQTESRDMAPGEGLPGRAYRSGTALWLADVADDAGFQRRQAAAASGIRAACAFPILVGQEVVAVVEFYNDRVAQPDDALLKLMPQVGTHLGRAIERQRAEDRLIHDASHDPLTGLPNRALFLDRLNEGIARSRRDARAQLAVLFVDLDRFKIVNDSLGHVAGDKLIIQVAARLKEAVWRGDSAGGTLARLGGDEFTILLNDVRDPSDAVRAANRVEEALRQPFSIAGQEIYTSASIGIASSATGYESADAILRDADIAMYRAKALGKARSELFDQKMHDAAIRRLALETDLRRALRDREFVLHYQPIVSLQDHQITGFEALVRWQKPDGTLVHPGDFIAVTEETGLIVLLGQWVLDEACRAAHALQKQFPRQPPLSISVNVSPRQFARPDLVALVRTILTETGIDPRSLRLEVTESVTIDDARRVAAVLSELKGLGVRLSIDDFGTGYSSLSYLHALPFDVLKIDRSFVTAMDKGAESLQIVKTIIALAHNLGMSIVAEGTEDAGQVAQLQAMGCEYGQGYYFSKPVDLAGAVGLLARPDWPAAAQEDGESWHAHQYNLLAGLFGRQTG